MKSYIQNISSYLRFCPGCGSFWEKTNFFCSECSASLNDYHRVCPVGFDRGYPHLSLWLWKRYEDNRSRWTKQDYLNNLLGLLIYGIKHQHTNQKMLKSLTNDLFVKGYESNFWPRFGQWYITFVPNQKDRTHSKNLAINLSKVTQIPLWNEWKDLNSSRNFKKKSKAQRSDDYIFKFKKRFPKNCGVILVDDLVTTGSTIRSVHKSLGRPQQFKVVSICDRQLKRNSEFLS